MRSIAPHSANSARKHQLRKKQGRCAKQAWPLLCTNSPNPAGAKIAVGNWVACLVLGAWCLVRSKHQAPSTRANSPGLALHATLCRSLALHSCLRACQARVACKVSLCISPSVACENSTSRIQHARAEIKGWPLLPTQGRVKIHSQPPSGSLARVPKEPWGCCKGRV